MHKQSRRNGSAANSPLFPTDLPHSSKTQGQTHRMDLNYPPSHLPGTPTTGNSTPQSLTNGRMATKTPTRINTDVSSGNRPSSAMTTRPDTPSNYDFRSSEAGATSQVNPTSALLQDLIREQRATRGSRRAASEYASDGPGRTPTKAPSQDDSTSEKQRKINNALSAGLKQPREMGFREMDEYVSKMNKLNFDLKLDIFHRAQQTLALEKKLERMQAMEEELERMHDLEEELEELREVEENNQRLRESNEQLRLELDKRDQAVNEAVDLICQLETKVEELEPSRDEARPSTAQPPSTNGPDGQDSNAFDATPKCPRILDVPDRTSSWRATSGSARSKRYRNATPDSSQHARRTPSFLRENNGSTSALRSLYLADETKSRATSSALSKTDSVLSGDEVPEPESPRLSILSECSYLSPYASPTRQLDLDMRNGPARQRNFTDVPRARLGYLEINTDEGKINRIGQWIQPHGTQQPTESKPAEYSTATVVRKNIPKETILGCPFQANHSSKRRPFDSPRIDGPVYDSSRLPPTPDTMSTSNTGPRSGSNSSIIAEKSQLDQAPFYTTFALNTNLNRPRSADDATTRPSSVASHSGSMETMSDATQNGLSTRGEYDTPSMFPSFNYTGRRAKTSHVRNTGSLDNPRLRDRGNSFVKAERIEEVDTSGRRKNYAASFKPTMSEPKSVRLINSTSPPLTPQDWLEAALPAQSKTNEHADDQEPSLPPNNLEPPLDPETPIPSIEPIETRASFLSRRATRRLNSEEPLPSRASSLRLRVSKNRAPANLDLPPRRRISLRPRFFSRSATPHDGEQVPMSDPVDRDGTPAAAVIRTKIMSAVRRQSISNPAETAPARAGAGTPPPGKESTLNDASHPQSAGAPPSRGSTLRPPTSDSAEYKRRSSHGILGWMRGATSSGQNKDGDSSFLPSPATIIRAMSPEKEKPFAPSGLANSTAISTSGQVDDEAEYYPQNSNVSAPYEDESDRRYRYVQRRGRVT